MWWIVATRTMSIFDLRSTDAGNFFITDNKIMRIPINYAESCHMHRMTPEVPLRFPSSEIWGSRRRCQINLVET
jgi:hypothetical protein